MNNIVNHYNEEFVIIWYKANILLIYLPSYFLNYNLIKIVFCIWKNEICWYRNLISFYNKESEIFTQFLYNAIRKWANNTKYNARYLFQLLKI